MTAAPQKISEASLQDQLDLNRRKVDFDTFDISVKELLSMVSGKLIDIAPEYQRKFRWDNTNQSRFIESVFLGIPIPPLFMATNADATWEVVDGLQRLSTLLHFCGDKQALSFIHKKEPLVLSDLEKLTAYEGKKFADLPDTIQRSFLLRSIKVTTLSDKSDKRVRFDLFERLNRGGIALEAQEIRACVYRGEFNEFLEEMAQNTNFRKVVRLPERSEMNGFREELVLRFFAYYYDEASFDHNVTEFLNQYMEKAQKKFRYRDSRKLFEAVFVKLAKALPNGITRGNRTTTPANLYEAIAVGAAHAYTKDGDIVTKNISRWMKSDELKRLTVGGTNSRRLVRQRIKYAEQRLRGQDA